MFAIGSIVIIVIIVVIEVIVAIAVIVVIVAIVVFRIIYQAGTPAYPDRTYVPRHFTAQEMPASPVDLNNCTFLVVWS